MGKSIGDYFNKLGKQIKADRLLSAQLKALTNAIRTGDDAKITRLFGDIKDVVLPGSKAYDKLLKETLHRNNVTAFSIISSVQKDPDYYLTTHSLYPATAGGMAGAIITREHVLHAAIDSGCVDIALALARNDKLSVDHAGGTEVLTGLNSSYIPLESSRELAVKNIRKYPRMAEVVAAIDSRPRAPAGGPRLPPCP